VFSHFNRISAGWTQGHSIYHGVVCVVKITVVVLVGEYE